MTLPWHFLDLVSIAAKPAGLWQIAIDYVSGSRLLRLQVISYDLRGRDVETLWHPCAGTDCTADGLHCDPALSGILSTTAQYGALIAKVGGSTADLPDSGSPSSPYGSKKVFAVGSFCIVSLAAGEGGPLFMTMNDKPESFAKHAGALHLLIEEYPV